MRFLTVTMYRCSIYIYINICKEASMALNIANRKVEEKAIHASRILGINKTAAVEKALDYYLQHHQADAVPAAHRQEAARLLDELTQLPLLDNRTADEILGYDKDGLPCE
ncbi:MAG: PSK operon transcription factor [Candidatus Electrothrix sp. AU1_5]|nr:PSK operon transcription factor [Candidatus Electrothrix gigas]